MGFYLAPFNGGNYCSAMVLILLGLDVAALWNGLLALIISSIEESGYGLCDGALLWALFSSGLSRLFNGFLFLSFELLI